MPVKKKIIILTDNVRKRIAKFIDQGYMKIEIATKIGITRQTLYRWEKKDEKLRDIFKEHLLIRSEDLKEEILKIADNKNGDLIKDAESGREYPNAANVSRSTLQIKAREKIMKYDNPEKFSGNTDVDVNTSGNSGLNIHISYGEDNE